MLPAELVAFTVELATELGLLGGFIGAMLYMLLRGIAVAAWSAVERSEWFMDWDDRRYVKRLGRLPVWDAGKAARARSQAGQITPAASFWLVAVVLALLAACATPEPPLSGSWQWWDSQREAAASRGW